MILLDTSGLLAVIDGSQRHHPACAAAMAAARAPRILSPFVLAELDYFLGKHVGHAAQTALLEEVAKEVYRLEPFAAADVARARDVIARHSALGLGLADASIVVLAGRYGVRDVLTLDERHFRVVRALDGSRFRLLPSDA